MVKVSNKLTNKRTRKQSLLSVLGVVTTTLLLIFGLVQDDAFATFNTHFNPIANRVDPSSECPISKIAHLDDSERHPVKGQRHMVDPPSGGRMHLVCCTTTKGPFSALVRETWAPRGAKRFLEMVQTGYFNAGVPLMRCVKNFICQAGLNNNPLLSKRFSEKLQDDPNWLPQGKDNRQNEQGVKRFARGYLAYAGSGRNTRSNQLIVALVDNPALGGGSPWEVPWGELVGQYSYDTTAQFYTGYGDKGPGQSKLKHGGMTDELRMQFPELDYITGCTVVDQQPQVAN
jgi:cyclophilin family peptidyl-prolyl cis-trans isomerase